MEAWWNQGGALLWNQYGGFGREEIVLTEEQVNLFLERASKMYGWEAEPFAVSAGEPRSGKPTPVIIAPDIETETTTVISDEPRPGSTQCCRDCGRRFHPGLAPLADQDLVTIPTRQLNHLLNGLQEAIEFSRGNGPNNMRTWEAALGGALQAIKRRI